MFYKKLFPKFFAKVTEKHLCKSLFFNKVTGWGLFSCEFFFFFFFLSGFSFTDTDNSQDSRGREGTFFYSTLPLLPAHEHLDIYVQLLHVGCLYAQCLYLPDCYSIRFTTLSCEFCETFKNIFFTEHLLYNQDYWCFIMNPAKFFSDCFWYFLQLQNHTL